MAGVGVVGVALRPILEKDTVITVPPVVYYAIRHDMALYNHFAREKVELWHTVANGWQLK